MPTTRATSTSAAGDVSTDIAAGPDQTPVQPSNSCEYKNFSHSEKENFHPHF